jgi:hypothetical protein
MDSEIGLLGKGRAEISDPLRSARRKWWWVIAAALPQNACGTSTGFQPARFGTGELTMRYLAFTVLALFAFSAAQAAPGASPSAPASLDQAKTVAANSSVAPQASSAQASPAKHEGPSKQVILRKRHRDAAALRRAHEARFWADVRRHRAEVAQMFGAPPARPSVDLVQYEPQPTAPQGGKCASISCPRYVLLGVGF